MTFGTDDTPMRISRLRFLSMSGEEMKRLSEFEITSRELYQVPTRNPTPNGLMDGRLGISDKAKVCTTCKKKLKDCAGHFGYINLALPSYHIGFIKHCLGNNP